MTPNVYRSPDTPKLNQPGTQEPGIKVGIKERVTPQPT